MDLDEFVKATILQVMRGVQSAASAAEDIDASAVVNPRFPNSSFGHLASLRFDVAVTVSGRTDVEAGGKVKVFSAFQAGGKGTHAHEQETVSRVQFEVPIALPSTPRDQYANHTSTRSATGQY